MANAWGGADPVEQVDAGDYELGTFWRAVNDITATHARIWTGAGENNIAGRKAFVWSAGGSILGQATLPDDLPTGWAEVAYDTPVELPATTQFVTSYSTGGDYGFISGAFTTQQISGDGNVVGVAAASAPNGNGLFNTTPGSFPTNGPGSNPFYGSDFVYTVGIGGNTAPEITALTADPNGAVVTATVAYVDAEDSTGATVRFNWGDGTSDTVVTYPTIAAEHTYAESGTYAVLATVTDSLGAASYTAVPVTVWVPSPEVGGLDVLPVLNRLVTHAASSGLFDLVNQHQPRSAPGHGLSVAIWPDDITPARSGLASTSVRLPFFVRIYSPIVQDPPDMIDPNLLAATVKLMTAYAGDFTLDGLARAIDLHGSDGPPFAARAGHARFTDGTVFRIMTITVPILFNDVWEQVP